MERWLKKGTLKCYSQEPEYFAVNSSHIDNHSNNENDTNEITPKDFRPVTKNNNITTKASYLVSYRIAQHGEAYTIAENLIKPCAMEIVKCM